MDPRFQSSFIPKKPIAAAAQSKRGPINLLSLIATVVFIVSLAAAAGSFFYQSYLNARIASDEQSLNLTKGQFDPATINQIIRLDTRLNVADSLLSGHRSLSNLFAALESTTIQSVRFTSFMFASGDQNALTLTLKGEALSFSDVALESAALNKTSYFKNISVGDLSVEPSGAVSFNATMTVIPSLVTYVPSATASSAAATPSSVPVVPAPAAASSTAATSSSKTTHP
jgi:hypothetical protein